MERYRRLPPVEQLKVAKAFAAVSIIVAIICATMLFLVLEDIPVDEFPSSRNPHDGSAVEMLMVDSPNLSNTEIFIIAGSMTTVLQQRQPRYSPHLRIVAYGAGAPVNVQLDQGLAAYFGDRDVFVIDVRKARAAMKGLKLSPLEGWAFIMGHEATHLIQKLQLRARVASRGVAYLTDPLELEAFQEGFDLVSAMRAAILQQQINGHVYTTSPTSNYTAEKIVYQNPAVKLRNSWTVRGQVVRFFGTIATFWHHDTAAQK